MKNYHHIGIVLMALCEAVVVFQFPASAIAAEPIQGPIRPQPVQSPSEPKIGWPFNYSFGVDGNLWEKGDMDNSTSPYWWVSSGGFLELKNGTGRTIQGAIDMDEKIRQLYEAANPVDTDGGIHPQNIFRMVLRKDVRDVSQEMYYKIEKYYLSPSPNRKNCNGIQQMSRYADQDNLYYTSLRVDGKAVIKKKYHGDYYDMAAVPVIDGDYDRLENPNLLPLGTWIGLKTVTKNLDATRVSIKLYTDIGRTGTWTLAVEAIDDGVSPEGPALTKAGRVGVRTDFMNVEFDDFSLEHAD